MIKIVRRSLFSIDFRSKKLPYNQRTTFPKINKRLRSKKNYPNLASGFVELQLHSLVPQYIKGQILKSGHPLIRKSHTIPFNEIIASFKYNLYFKVDKRKFLQFNWDYITSLFKKRRNFRTFSVVLTRRAQLSFHGEVRYFVKLLKANLPSVQFCYVTEYVHTIIPDIADNPHLDDKTYKYDQNDPLDVFYTEIEVFVGFFLEDDTEMSKLAAQKRIEQTLDFVLSKHPILSQVVFLAVTDYISSTPEQSWQTLITLHSLEYSPGPVHFFVEFPDTEHSIKVVNKKFIRRLKNFLKDAQGTPGYKIFHTIAVNKDKWPKVNLDTVIKKKIDF
jgi:hypothetical protein